MTKQIVIKDRLKARPFNDIEDAIREAKSTTSTVKRTSTGIRIKRFTDLLILF